ncbi:hypothetical protein FOZ62_004961 [Perkinsus olseni]|uniref:Uncharacterized protein n=1 Tax=Perkinsus olseni TaxID=32597 RepID=A0A7J6SB00_PEROL|nr:hypothetical protein FOZ62_004961 [Perkinsus olseni]
MDGLPLPPPTRSQSAGCGRLEPEDTRQKGDGYGGFEHEIVCPTEDLCQHLLSLFDNEKYADVVLKPTANDEEGEYRPIHANRAILAPWSPVLEQKLFPSDESNTLLLPIDRQTEGGLPVLPIHCGYRTLYQTVSYIYGHPLTLDLKDLWPLYCFLSTYQFKKDFLGTIQRVLEESVGENGVVLVC